jgi:hypothetical protein
VIIDKEEYLKKKKRKDFKKKYYWCHQFQKFSQITDPLEKYSKLGIDYIYL